MAGRHPADRTSAGSASASSGTWAGCTTRLSYLGEDPIHRSYHHNEMTFSIDVRVQRELRPAAQSHDEVVHGKGSLWGRMPGDAWNKAAGVRALLGVHVGPPGQAAAVHGRRVRAGARSGPSRASLDWQLLDDPLHAGILRLVSDLNAFYRTAPALWTNDDRPEGFRWIDASDTAGNVIAFLRIGADGSTGRLHRELRRAAAPRLPDRAAGGRDVARGAQHRRRGVRRFRGRQPGGGGGRGRPDARVRVLGRPPAAAQWRPLAHSGPVVGRAQRGAMRRAPSMRMVSPLR